MRVTKSIAAITAAASIVTLVQQYRTDRQLAETIERTAAEYRQRLYEEATRERWYESDWFWNIWRALLFFTIGAAFQAVLSELVK